MTVEITWGAIGVLLTGLTAIVGIILLALDERARRKFASRDDLNGVGRKVEMLSTQFVSLDDRTGDLEEDVAVLKERQTQQWERIAERMSETAQKLEAVSESQQKLALRMERLMSQSNGHGG